MGRHVSDGRPRPRSAPGRSTRRPSGALFLAAALLAALQPALTAPLARAEPQQTAATVASKGCWERGAVSAVSPSGPTADALALRLELAAPDQYGYSAGRLEARPRGAGEGGDAHVAGLVCRPQGPHGRLCALDCEGGGFVLRPHGGDGAVQMENAEGGLRFACDARESLPAVDAARLIRLFPCE